MNYTVHLKSGVSILVEGVTSIRHEGADGFIEFYNDKEIVGSFNVDDVSYFVKIDNPQDFKTMVVTTSVDDIPLSDIHKASLTSMKNGDFI